MIKQRRCVTLTTIIVLWNTSLVLTPAADAQPFSEIVAFGASLTDSGNTAITSRPLLGHSVPVSPPYFMGRYTNGPSWLDVLADELAVERPSPSGAGGTNFAWGGATISTVPNEFEIFGVLNIDEQIASYLEANTPRGDELFVLATAAAAGDVANGQDSPADVAEHVGRLVSDLNAAGATNFLVMGQLSSPRLPRPDLAGPYNEELSRVFAELRSTHDNLSIYEFDAETVFRDVVTNPAAYGITFIEGQACLDCRISNPSPAVVDNPNDYLYFDNAVHFTERVHYEFGIRAVQSIPEPTGGSILAFGIFVTGIMRRSWSSRNQAHSKHRSSF